MGEILVPRRRKVIQVQHILPRLGTAHETPDVLRRLLRTWQPGLSGLQPLTSGLKVKSGLKPLQVIWLFSDRGENPPGITIIVGLVAVDMVFCSLSQTDAITESSSYIWL